MSQGQEYQRLLDSSIRQLEESLILQSCYLRFEEWTSKTDKEKDLPHLDCGGVYDSLTLSYTGDIPEDKTVIKLLPSQVPVLESKGPCIAIFGGMRSGKTEAGVFYAIRQMVEKPNSTIFVVVPALSDKAQIWFGKIKDYVPHYISSEDKKSFSITFVNGSTLRIFSGKPGNEESFIGSECDVIILEEFGLIKQIAGDGDNTPGSGILMKAFSRVISKGGKLIIISTPRPFHAVETIQTTGRYNENEFDVFALSSLKNYYNPQEWFAICKKFYSPNLYKRDVLGESIAVSGQDYYNFDTRKHIVDKLPGIRCTELLWSSPVWLSKSRSRCPLPDPRDLKRREIVGLDFGNKVMSAVGMAISVEGFGVEPEDITLLSAHITVVREMIMENTDIMAFIKHRLIPKGYRPDNTRIFCDPSGKQRSPSTGRSAVDVLEHYGYDVRYRSSGRELSTEAVRTRIHLNRFSIHKSCYRTIDSVLKMRSANRSLKEVSRDPHGHLCDAIRYVIHFLFPYHEVLSPKNLALFRATHEGI